MADLLRMAVLTSKIRAGLLLPLLIATVVLMLLGHQAIGSTPVVADETLAVSHLAEPESDCAGNGAMHSTTCCPVAALTPIATSVCFYGPLRAVRLIDRESDAAVATLPSKLYRPPRAA